MLEYSDIHVYKLPSYIEAYMWLLGTFHVRI